jgi:hypothetical protein
MTRKGNFGHKGKTIVCFYQIFRVGNQKIKEKKGSEEQNPHLPFTLILLRSQVVQAIV